MRRIIPLVVLVLVAVACGPSPAERAQLVADARAAVAEPAAEVGTVAEAVVAAARGVRLEGPEDATDRQVAVAAVINGPLADFRAAVASLERVNLAGETGDVAAARDAVAVLVAAATDLANAAERELRQLERVLARDAELQEITDAWQESGSRSAQLTAFAENADRADQLEEDLAADDPPTCPEQLRRRQQAAEFVAATTRELRDHIAAFRGATFDERRLELAEDPTGLGASLSVLDAADAACWTAASEVDTASIRAALADLQSALNPNDL